MKAPHLVTISLCVALTLIPSQPHEAEADVNSEAAILQLVVDQVVERVRGTGRPVSRIVLVENRTDWRLGPKNWDRAYIADQVPQLQEDTLTDFEKKVAQPPMLPRDLRLDPVPTVLSEREIRAFFDDRDSNWERFYEAYPGAQGYTLLSAIGYSRDGKQALIYSATHSDTLAGFGGLVLLERSGDAWGIVSSMPMWYS